MFIFVVVGAPAEFCDDCGAGACVVGGVGADIWFAVAVAVLAGNGMLGVEFCGDVCWLCDVVMLLEGTV